MIVKYGFLRFDGLDVFGLCLGCWGLCVVVWWWCVVFRLLMLNVWDWYMNCKLCGMVVCERLVWSCGLNVLGRGLNGVCFELRCIGCVWFLGVWSWMCRIGIWMKFFIVMFWVWCSFFCGVWSLVFSVVLENMCLGWCWCWWGEWFLWVYLLCFE